MRHEISQLKENLEMERRENRLNNDKIRVLEIELAEERKIIKRERSDNTERESKLQKSQLDMIEKLNERNKEMAHLETKLKKQEKDKLIRDVPDDIQDQYNSTTTPRLQNFSFPYMSMVTQFHIFNEFSRQYIYFGLNSLN